MKITFDVDQLGHAAELGGDWLSVTGTGPDGQPVTVQMSRHEFVVACGGLLEGTGSVTIEMFQVDVDLTPFSPGPDWEWPVETYEIPDENWVSELGTALNAATGKDRIVVGNEAKAELARTAAGRMGKTGLEIVVRPAEGPHQGWRDDPEIPRFGAEENDL